MIGRLIDILRSLRASWLWLAEVREMLRTDDAVYAADTIALMHARHPSPRDCPTFDCAVCLARNDPTRIGRQASEGAAILEIAGWLVSNGFHDVERGELQRYACWIRRARADYEKAQVMAS